MKPLKVLEELIAIDSQCNKSNSNIIRCVTQMLSGFQSTEYTFSKGGLDLYNLVVKIPGERTDNPIVFVGHTDTVVASSQWQTNPFQAHVKDGKMYGLGSADMKSGLACMISAAVNLKQKPKNDVYLLFDADEEDGGEGGRELVKRFDISNARVIVAEPSDGKIVYAQKGCLDMELIFMGIAKHSSMADREYNLKHSAISKAIAFANKLDNYSAQIETRNDAILGKPTINLGKIMGGTGANIVADKCVISICRRLIPSERIDDEYEAISCLAKSINHNVSIKTTFFGQPFLADVNSELIKNLQTISKQCSLDGELAVKPFWTEASLFAKYGQTVIFGPGQTEFCHQPNESVKLKDLEIFFKIYSKLMSS
jgi:acetylornithine deacetylase/succinyl-diaminopimelate desuccinylase family protein